MVASKTIYAVDRTPGKEGAARGDKHSIQALQKVAPGYKVVSREEYREWQRVIAMLDAQAARKVHDA